MKTSAQIEEFWRVDNLPDWRELEAELQTTGRLDFPAQAIESVELDESGEYVPEWWENWPVIEPLSAADLFDDGPTEDEKRLASASLADLDRVDFWQDKPKQSNWRTGIILAIVLAWCMFGGAPDNTDVDSESYSQDGMVCLRLGSHEYKFTPNIARAIADDFRKSADELEGSAE